MRTMIDLCSGFGGASAFQSAHGWRVVRIDIEPRVRPSIIADVAHLPIQLDYRPLLVWGSPVCTDYSRWDQRASLGFGETYPDLTMWRNVQAAIAYLDPLFWVIENVRGAQDWWGRADYHFGPYYLWTNIPLLSPLGHRWPSKRSYCGGGAQLRSAKRGRIPYAISHAVAAAVGHLADAPRTLIYDDSMKGET